MPPMWPTSGQTAGNNSDPFHDVKEQVSSIADNVAALGNIGATLNKFYDSYRKQEQAEQSEDFGISTTEARTYRAGGYRYNRLYVSDGTVQDGAKMIIAVGGISWTVTLTAGENVLNMPDGATYQGATTSTDSFAGYLVRSNKA